MQTREINVQIRVINVQRIFVRKCYNEIVDGGTSDMVPMTFTNVEARDGAVKFKKHQGKCSGQI